MVVLYDVNSSLSFSSVENLFLNSTHLGRIYHLVNYRTEPLSSLSSQKNKLLANNRRGAHEGGQARTEADQVVQADGEQGGAV